MSNRSSRIRNQQTAAPTSHGACELPRLSNPRRQWLGAFGKTAATATLCMAWICASAAQGHSATPPTAPQSQPHRPMTTITPIFSQLLAFSLPAGFVIADEQHNDHVYLRESVLQGETVDDWSQMITVIGRSDLASNPQATPEAVAEMAGSIYAKACPGTLTVKDLGPTKLDGRDAYMAFFGCGTVTQGAGAPHTESMVVLALQGERDSYVIQWAQRGPASSTPPAFDRAHWMTSLNSLAPIKLCAIKPGEAEPYPSCIDRKVAEHFQ